MLDGSTVSEEILLRDILLLPTTLSARLVELLIEASLLLAV